MKLDPAQFYKYLADETRLKALLLIVQEQELCVCELTQALNLSQPKVSRHLAQLREGGILEGRKAGLWVFYRLAPNLPEWVVAVLEQTAHANAAYIKSANSKLAAMGDRPTRTQSCC